MTLPLVGVHTRWTAMAYESKKLHGCQRKGPTNEKKIFAVVHCLKMWQYYFELQKTKVYTDNVSLKYIETQMQVSAESLRWHDTFALMDVELIHKPGYDNVVPDALNGWEEFEAMSTTQIIFIMFDFIRKLVTQDNKGIHQ
jgi:hypothetical protein